jgi:hypothetical protein
MPPSTFGPWLLGLGEIGRLFREIKLWFWDFSRVKLEDGVGSASCAAELFKIFELADKSRWMNCLLLICCLELEMLRAHAHGFRFPEHKQSRYVAYPLVPDCSPGKLRPYSLAQPNRGIVFKTHSEGMVCC